MKRFQPFQLVINIFLITTTTVISTEKYKPNFTLAKNPPAFLKYQKLFFKNRLAQRRGVHAIFIDITISECVKYFAPTPATIQNAINNGIHEYRS